MAENGLGIPVDMKLNMGQGYALGTKKANGLSRPMEVILPLCLALIRPHLNCFLVQERCGHIGESPAKGQENDEGTGASFL